MNLVTTALVFSALLPGNVLAFSKTIAYSANQICAPVPKTPTRTSPSSTTTIWGPWEMRFQELAQFLEENGHCQVPKRYDPNKPLANWVSKQRQEHRKFMNGEKASITLERIEALENVGFCWNVQAKEEDKNNHDEESLDFRQTTEWKAWYERFNELSTFMSENNLVSVFDPTVSENSTLHQWIQQQRHILLGDSKKIEPGVYQAKTDMLSRLDPHWCLNRHQLVWETRYQELVAYTQEHGDCCVPISYSNKKLANWVNYQRKLYNEQLKGRRNSLDGQRIRRLEQVGFVWNRWEYEFDRKNVAEGVGSLN